MHRQLSAALACLLSAAAGAQQSTLHTPAFTYQGVLRENGELYNGDATLEFRWYFTETGPSLIGEPIVTQLPVENGVFTARLNALGEFGGNAFDGYRRWLDVRVNGRSFAKRVEILPVPYAHWALGPWRTIGEHVAFDKRAGLGVTAPPSARLEIRDGSTLATAIDAAAYAPLKITSPVSQEALLFDTNQIESAGGSLFINSRQQNGAGNNVIVANGGGNVGIGTGSPSQRLHVAGNALFTGNIFGDGSLLFGGVSTDSPQLILTNNGTVGINTAFADVTLNVRPRVLHSDVFQVEDFFGNDLLNVTSSGLTTVRGVFSVAGTKNFIIDHPEAPTDKFLLHNAVEGPGYYTHYQGNAVLDAEGAAWVTLPDYFDSLNTDPTYNLTCIGAHAPVYIAEEVRDNRFRIAGGRPGMKVSWIINAVRKDAYAADHPYQAVQDKQGSDRGTRLYTPAARN